MKPDIKRVLEEAYEVPKPTRKKEFLRKIGLPQISTFSFVTTQISYIRKWVWLASVLVFAGAVWSVDFVGEDCIWAMSAMMPFIALCTITESARSATYGMAELEMASRFSLKGIILARLAAIGLVHFFILCVLIPVAGNNAFVSFGRVGIYLLAPYLLTCVSGLVTVRKVHGKEAIYICMGIAVIVSFFCFIGKKMIPGLYEQKRFIWWVVLVMYLLARAWSEYKKVMEQTEEFAWN